MTHRFSSRLAPVLLAGALAASACTDTSGNSSGNTSRPGTTDLSSEQIILTSGLETFGSCDALLDQIKDEAIERVGPYGFDQGGHYFIEGDVALATDDVAEEATADFETSAAAPATTAAASLDQAFADGGTDTASRAADGDFSETNNQEQGVDEADLVKTDGNRLVIVSGNTLRVIDTTASTPRLVNTIKLPQETWGGQLFLEGDRALLMTSGWTERPFLERSITTDWYPGSPIGRLLEIDLVGGDITRTLEFEGSYLSAREIDGSIRIVLTASANRFAFVYPSNPDATDGALEANRNVIESSTIEHWIPTYRITEGSTTVNEGPIVDCNRVHLPAEFAGFGSLVMLTADLRNGLAINDALSVFTDAQTVYASTDRVAVATPRWPMFDDDGQPDSEDFRTALHTFDITDPSSARYVASGSVEGSLLNQFSLSEYDGYLRVATTAGSPWWGERSTSESSVTVLAEEGNTLRQVGHVGGLGLGEQIFAVRFIGDKGYVVTFEQVDPLYTIDLADPTDPRVVGELKIPGFSSYLHPVDGDHLLGVGTDGDEEGRTGGAVISLFDVSDPANPERTAKLNLDRTGLGGTGEESGSYSPVSWDAKAFTYWNGTAIVPISWWAYDPGVESESNGSDAVLVDVDVDGNLTEIGRVSHPETTFCEEPYDYIEEEQAVPATDEDSTDAEAGFVDGPDDDGDLTEPQPGRYCYSWTPEIQRSIIIGDDLYTVSEGGVKVSRFDGLADVTWIPFEQQQR